MRGLHLSAVMYINLSFSLYNILKVDTVQGMLSIGAGFYCVWQDERMTWNSSDHAGINSIKIQQQYVWTPPLVASQPLAFDSLGEKWITVTYHPDGKASWSPGGMYLISCPLNMKHWPYDEHTCTLGYLLYDYTDSDIVLQPGSFLTKHYTENGEWSLVSTHIGTRNMYGVTEVLFTMKLHRNSGFFTNTLVIPLIVLSLLSSFVFLLPNESGERVSYCITILLSETVFLDVISDEIPKLSNPLPVICQFLLAGVIMCAFITVTVILNLAIFHRDEHMPIPSYYITLVKIFCRSKNKVQASPQSWESDVQQGGKEANKLHRPVPQLLVKTKVFQAQGATSETDEPTVSESSKESEITWQDVSKTLDKIFFVLSTSIAMMCITAMVLILRLNL